MNIVNFTPISALTGGITIGFAVLIFFLFNGRLIGISGIASNFINREEKRLDNFLFLVGLILGPIIYKLFFNKEINKHLQLINSIDCCRSISWIWYKN